MDNFDIDFYKGKWQAQNQQKKYDKERLETMINSTSKGYVRYILWICILEFLLFTLFMLVSIYSPTSFSFFSKILNFIGIKLSPEFFQYTYFMNTFISRIGIVISLVFIFIFYISYRKIKVESNFKNFTHQIKNFHNKVTYYIFINIGLVVLFNLISIFFIVYVASKQDLSLEEDLVKTYLSQILMNIISVVIFIFFYYKIVYGIILSRIKNNIKLINEIEKNS